MAASNTRAEPSLLPVATSLPSGANATAHTGPSWSRRARVHGWRRSTWRRARSPCRVASASRDSAPRARATVVAARPKRNASSESAARRNASARLAAASARTRAFSASCRAVSARSRASLNSRSRASAAVWLLSTKALTAPGMSSGRVSSQRRASAIRASGSGSPSAARCRMLASQPRKSALSRTSLWRRSHEEIRASWASSAYGPPAGSVSTMASRASARCRSVCHSAGGRPAW